MSRLPRPAELLPGSTWLDTLALLAARHRRRQAAALERQRAAWSGMGGTVGRWVLADASRGALEATR